MAAFRPPPPADLALAAALTILGVAQVALQGGSAVEASMVAAMTLPVALRRTMPLVAVGVAWFVLLLEGGLGTDVTSQGYAAVFALWVLVYSVARHGHGYEPLAGLGWALACVWASVFIAAAGIDLPSLGLTAIVTVAPWLAGTLVRRAAQGRSVAEDDAERVRADAERHTSEAIAGERTRIAREVHDVLGHTLGVMVLQLGAADHAMDNDPGRAREAIRSARAAGKTALDEVRYLIGLSGTATATMDPPVRRMGDIPGLVEQVRDAGRDIDLVFEPGPEESPEGSVSAVELAAYRIVQEALTNAVRHGRDPIRVSVRADGADVVIDVRNALRPDGPPQSAGGTGVIGMTERARSCGGTLSAQREAGAFVVEARLPRVDPA